MRLGIIGTGRIARRFVPECAAEKSFHISAVYNPHAGSARRFVEELWPDTDGKAPTAMDDAEAFWEETDAVYIASPHDTHHAYIMDALAHGKHVLCEKPLTLCGAQAQEAFDAAREKGLVLMEAVKTAYCPGYEKLLQTASGGLIGEIRHIEACFTKLEQPASRELTDIRFGGSFTELGTYVLLPVMDLFGADYTDVSFHSIGSPEGIDLFTKADLRYADASAFLICGLGVKSEGRLLIAGTKGYLKVPAPWWKTSRFEAHFEDPSDVRVFEEPFAGDGLRYETGHFYRMIQSPDMRRMRADETRSICMAALMEKFLSRRGETT